MRRSLCTVSALALLSITPGELQAQSWTTKAPVPGNVKDYDNPISFTVNNKIYLGGGIYSIALKEYDPSTNTWTAKADIPGTTYSRVGAMSFSINGKGYVGLGADFNPTTFAYDRKADMNEYNAGSNTYTPKANFPGTPRSAMAWFVVNGKAYMVGGSDTSGSLDEVWEFDPAANTWTQKMAYPPGKITGASGFTIGTKGYIALGNLKVGTGPAAATKKLYEYDPATNTWTPKADFPDVARFSATAFVLNGKAYVGLGASLATMSSYDHYSNFYTYDPSTGWGPAITNFPGAPRQHQPSEVVNNKAYVGTGWTYINNANTYYKDWYEFSSTLGINGTEHAAASLNIYPNPAGDVLHVDMDGQSGDAQYTIYTMTGQKVASEKLKNNRIAVDAIPTGEYILEVASPERTQRKTMNVLHK